eukprot:873851-Amphidinium_carterae.3
MSVASSDISDMETGAQPPLQAAGAQPGQGLDPMAALQQQNQQLYAMMTQMQAEMTQMRQAQGQASVQAAPSRAQAGAIDTRLIGKPETFSGGGSGPSWKDWSIVMRSYATVSVPALGPLSQKAQQTDDPIGNAALSVDQAQASAQMFYLLIMTCRESALTRVINSGDGEGLQAWRQLCRFHEPSSAARHASLLLDLLSFSLAEGDLQSRLEDFDRTVARYESVAQTRLAEDVRMGIILRGVADGPIKQHLLLNMDKFTTYATMKESIIAILRATQAAMSVSTPMDLSALQSTKGAKGKGKGRDGAQPSQKLNCSVCGKRGHTAANCWHRPGGKGNGKQQQQQHQQPQQQQQQGKGGQQKACQKPNKQKCFNCGKRGHIAANCRGPKKLQALEQAPQQQQTGQQQQQQQNNSAGQAGPLASLFLSTLSLQAVSSEGSTERSVRFGIDSGAGITAIPPSASLGYPIHQDGSSGQVYHTATGEHVKDGGRIELVCSDSDGLTKKIRGRSCQVGKGLISVADMVSAGHRVVFEQDEHANDISHALHKETGTKTSFVFRNRTWDLDLVVQPHSVAAVGMELSLCVGRLEWRSRKTRGCERADADECAQAAAPVRSRRGPLQPTLAEVEQQCCNMNALGTSPFVSGAAHAC